MAEKLQKDYIQIVWQCTVLSPVLIIIIIIINIVVVVVVVVSVTV